MSTASSSRTSLLQQAAARLRSILEDKPIIMKTPPKAEAAMRFALEAVEQAIGRLESGGGTETPSEAVSRPRGGPPTSRDSFWHSSNST